MVDGLARCTAESWGQRIEEVTDDDRANILEPVEHLGKMAF
ncbi:MAG: hypothetical protein QOJ58_4287 [Alphaproteobacteria bacterium]|nr:hypothetical protein [Alphaproteobacteria bacterium]